VQAQLHGISLKTVGLDDDQCNHVPFRFCSSERISKIHKLLLSFDALAFSQAVGNKPRYGDLIVGRDLRRTRMAPMPFYPEVISILESAGATLAAPSTPPPVLNRHCSECQFAIRCKSEATEVDDLSLLSKMSAAERHRYHERGIFTVTQLSHTFRYRKRARKLKQDHSLKALAIRKNQVHVPGELAFDGTGSLFTSTSKVIRNVTATTVLDSCLRNRAGLSNTPFGQIAF
jgi:predicted RecB family nuclease